jgi:hypothetical protein
MCFELISLKSLLVGWATLWKLHAQIYIRTEPLYKLKDLNWDIVTSKTFPQTINCTTLKTGLDKKIN